MDNRHLIVIIDDDTDDSELLATAITANYDDISIMTFSDGGDFFEFMEAAAVVPSIVITDLYMPAITGLDIIHNLKAQPGTSDIPIALLSTIKNQLACDSAVALGVVHYFIKPVTLIEYSVLADTIMSKLHTPLSRSTKVTSR